VLFGAFFFAFLATPLANLFFEWIDKKKAEKSQKREFLAQKPPENK